MKVDFSEFDKQDKTSWLLAAEKALKGKPYDGLTWKVDDHISLEPFYTEGEWKGTSSLEHPSKDNNWLIGESFNGDDASHLNDQLLKALAYGLDSPLLFDVSSFEQCLENVSVDFLFPIFRGGRLEDYMDWIKAQKLDPTQLKGAFIAYEADFGKIDLTESIPKLKRVSDSLPSYFHSHITFSIDPENLGSSIGRHLVQLSDMIYQLKLNGIPVKIICETETDNNFIKSIAILRALRLMITQICSAYEIPTDSILFDAYVNQTAQDMQLGMIGASSQAMAAVTAGIDRLTISCESMNVQEDEEVNRRMTRNVHHLMKMESGLDKVADPLAGSYSVEQLTQQIAKQSWGVFQKG